MQMKMYAGKIKRLLPAAAVALGLSLTAAVPAVAMTDSAEANTATEATPAEIPVLMYHSVSDHNPKKSTSITPVDKFRTEMELIQEAGFTPIWFRDYTEFLENGTPLPDNPILITFDDGYLDNYTNAYPILKEMNMKATISIIVSTVGRTEIDGKPILPHFTWEQAKEMYDSGIIDIQHHTYNLHREGKAKGLSHKKGEKAERYKARIKADLSLAKRLIEENVGNVVDVFVYPYGLYNEASEEILKELGFRYSLTVNEGVADLQEGGYLLKRINMTPRIASDELIWKFYVPHVYAGEGKAFPTPFRLPIAWSMPG